MKIIICLIKMNSSGVTWKILVSADSWNPKLFQARVNTGWKNEG